MKDLLKGNFQTKNDVVATTDKEESVEDRFEREAMRKLGGSICFVAKKKVKWSPDP